MSNHYQNTNTYPIAGDYVQQNQQTGENGFAYYQPSHFINPYQDPGSGGMNYIFPISFPLYQQQQHQPFRFPIPSNQPRVPYSHYNPPYQNYNTPQYNETSNESQNTVTQSSRQKKFLDIKDPNTGNLIDLKEISKKPQSESNSVTNIVQSSVKKSLILEESKGNDVKTDVSSLKITSNNDSIILNNKSESVKSEATKLLDLNKEDIFITAQLDSEQVILDSVNNDNTDNKCEIISDSVLYNLEDLENNQSFRYDFATLMSLSKHPESCKRPEDLPNIQDITKTVIGDPPDMFFQLGNSLSRSKTLKNSFKTPLKPGQKFPNVFPNGSRVININTNVPVLKESENTFKPRFKNKTCPTASEELKRKIVLLLNKMTPENFQSIKNDIIKLPIKNSEDLFIICTTIFEKATKEHCYSAIFAQLISQVQNTIFVTDDVDSKKQVFLRAIIIKFCQTQFETDYHQYVSEHTKTIDKEIESETDSSMKELLATNRDDRIKQKIDSYFGNIRFIGELLKVNVLKPMIFNICISHLIKIDTVHAMDCFCQLLTCCGNEMDNERFTGIINSAFEYIESKLKLPLENRLKFKFMELKDMRDRKWKMREIHKKLEIKPTTLREVRETIDIDRQEDKKRQMQREKSDSSFNNYSLNKSASFSKNVNTLNMVIKSNACDTPDFLGPPETHNSWNKGSSALKNQSKPLNDKSNKIGEGWQQVDARNKTTKVHRKDSPGVTTQNRFTSQISQLSTSSGRSTPVISDLNSSPLSSAFISSHMVTGSNSSLLSTEEIASQTNKQTYDRDSLLSIGKIAIDSYIATEEFDEQDFQIPEVYQIECVEACLESIIENKEAYIEKSGMFFNKAVSKFCISLSNFVEGFNHILDIGADLVTDIPKIWIYLGLVLSGFIDNRNSNISFLQDLRFSDKKDFEDMLISLFTNASKKLGQGLVAAVFRNSELNWSKLLPHITDINSFLSNNKLDFTVLFRHRSESQSISDLKLQLKTIDKKDNEDIFNVIDEYITLDGQSQPEFLEAMVDYVIDDCFERQKYIPSKFQDRVAILKRYKTPGIEKIIQPKILSLNLDDSEKNCLIDDLTSNFLSRDAFSVFNNNEIS